MMNKTAAPVLLRIASILFADRALTARELARFSGISIHEANVHLAVLRDAGIISAEQAGKCCYFRLVDGDASRALESHMGIKFREGTSALPLGVREAALRKARVCYRHLAGELAVQAYDSLIMRRALCRQGNKLQVGETGAAWFAAIGIDIVAMASRSRALCTSCLDCSERRHHLGGALGGALLTRIIDLGWADRQADSRALHFSPSGVHAFLSLFA